MSVNISDSASVHLTIFTSHFKEDPEWAKHWVYFYAYVKGTFIRRLSFWLISLSD